MTYQCNYCGRKFNGIIHHNCKDGFRKRKHKMTEIEKSIFEKEFASFEIAEQLHKEEKQFHAFGYWNLIGSIWKLKEIHLIVQQIL